MLPGIHIPMSSISVVSMTVSSQSLLQREAISFATSFASVCGKGTEDFLMMLSSSSIIPNAILVPPISNPILYISITVISEYSYQ